MEIVDINIAGESVQPAAEVTTASWWGLQHSWWPARLCRLDYWTTGVWQITLLGRSARCSDATGRTLAEHASRTIRNSRGIQNYLANVTWSPLTTAPVQCVQMRSGQLTYTISVQTPRPAMAALRTTMGSTFMRGIYNTASVRSLGLTGNALTHTKLLLVVLVEVLDWEPVRARLWAFCSRQDIWVRAPSSM
jgi:hypothetical protein